MDDDNANILDDLIHNLVLRFEKITTIDNALDSFSQWLIEYSWFFKKNRPRLSKAAQRGLIGELIFLKDYAMNNRTNINALNAWRGHDEKYMISLLQRAMSRLRPPYQKSLKRL